MPVLVSVRPLPHFTDHAIMLHQSIAQRYVAHRTLYTRLLRLCFTLAGVYWIIIYLLPDERHVELRAGQSVIYFILMTLWGLDYMREQRRLAVIIEAANRKACAPQDVTFEDISAKASLFTMLRPVSGLWGTITPILFLAGLLAAYALVLLQYVRAVAPH
jgi:hypothetical protein